MKSKAVFLDYNPQGLKRSLQCLALLLLSGLHTSAQEIAVPPPDLTQLDCDQYIAADASLFDTREPDLERLLEIGAKHRLHGTASYYSTFFNDRKTANGERFHNSRVSAAHRTLPLGSWVEVRSLATGRKIRLRVNDRGPFKGGFIIDLSQSAARRIGVDRAADRRVEITLLALPGEDPIPEEEESEGDNETERTALIKN